MTALDRPLTLGETLDLPLQLLRREFRGLVRVTLVTGVLMLLPGLPALLLSIADPTTLVQNMPLLVLLTYGGGALSWFMAQITAVAMSEATRLALAGEPVGLGRCFGLALSWKPLLTYLLLGVFYLVALTLCCVPIIPAALFASLIPAAIVFERSWGPDAFSRSFQLVAFNPGTGLRTLTIWRVLAVIVVGGLFTWAIGSLSSTPLLVVTMVKGFRDGLAGGPLAVEQSTGMVVFQLVSQIVTHMVQSVGRLYGAMLLVLVFVSARNLREGHDIDAEIGARRAALEPSAP